jgi:hypothetical protein
MAGTDGGLGEPSVMGTIGPVRRRPLSDYAPWPEAGGAESAVRRCVTPYFFVDGSAPVADTKAMSGSDEEKASTIEQVVERLAGRFPDADRGLIAGIVSEEYEALDSGRIRAFIPTLVEKGAKTRLRRELASEGSGAGG